MSENVELDLKEFVCNVSTFTLETRLEYAAEPAIAAQLYAEAHLIREGTVTVRETGTSEILKYDITTKVIVKEVK